MSSASPSTAKRKVLTLNVKRAILDEVRRNVKKSDIAHRYGIAPSTLSTIIKNGDKIDATLNDDAGSADRKRIRKPVYDDVEEALYKWFVDARAKGVPLSGPIILEKARNLAFVLGHDEFKPGNGWLQRFKDRHSITCKHIVGEAASVDDASLEAWCDKHIDRIFANYTDRDIYNADETGLFYQLLPSKTLASKDDKCIGSKTSKERVTVLVCANMDGTDKRRLLVIGKARKPRGFATILSLPVTYAHNKKAWMTGDCFLKWLLEFDADMASRNRKVLLLLDNCSAHHVNPLLKAVEVLFLPPNTTAKLQPMDQGVIANLKVHYRRRVIERLLVDIRTGVLPKARKVTLANAVFMISGAWRDVKSETIAHCFKSAGFCRARMTEDSSVGSVAEGIAPAVELCAPLEQMWESMAEEELVPTGVDLVEFVTTEDDIIATEELSDEALVNQSPADEVGASDSESDGDDDSQARPAATSTGTALAAIETLRSYFVGAVPGQDVFAHLDGLEAAVLKTSLTRGVQSRIDRFFVKQ